MDINEFLTYAGIFIGALVMAIAGYRKKPETTSMDPVIAGVGLEIGNRQQADEQIQQLRRIAVALEILADRKQADMEDKIDELLRRADHAGGGR